MSLEEKLAAIRAGAADRIPAASLAIMHRVTEDLERSGIADRALSPGDQVPSFELAGNGGEQIASAALLARGPLVVTFYRGVW